MSCSHGDIDLEVFRKQGHELIEWIVSYLSHPECYPVLARTRPGEIQERLPEVPPERGEPLERILEDMEELVVPGLTHWNHPGFMAYFGITGSVPGILGELLTAAFNVNAMLWKTAPAATELEQVVLGWLRRMLGLPADFFGVIQDTASISTLCALVAAREALSDLDVRRRGLSGVPPLCYYMSEEAHSSVEKAGIVLGVGQDHVRKIPVDDRFRMDVSALEHAIQADLDAGFVPFAAVATVGTTSTTSVDPVPAIADICERYRLWMHVDAAYAGAAGVLPELREITDGCERADSLVVNPHKWLFTPIDCSALYCRRPEVLKRAFSLVPEYLKTGEQGEVTNLMDYGVALGRRFRALKLWLVLRAFGVEGIRVRLREHIRLARLFKGWIEEDPDFELMAPAPFSVVCFRAMPHGWKGSEADLDRLNGKLLEAVNESGEAFLSHTVLHGRYTLRLAVGNLRTSEVHVRRVWELLKSELDALAAA